MGMHNTPQTKMLAMTWNSGILFTYRRWTANLSTVQHLHLDMASIEVEVNLFPPGSSEEDPGSLQNYLPNICHDLRQMIQIGDTEKTGCVRHGEMH